MRAGTPSYSERFQGLIRAVRTDFNQPDLPFLYVQLGRYISSLVAANWNQVQIAQLETEKALLNAECVAAVDLELDDAAHVAVHGLKRIGHRLANLACVESSPKPAICADIHRGPRPLEAHMLGHPDHSDGEFDIAVRFSDVNDRLVADGRIGGFSLRKQDGSELFQLYRATLDPDSPNSIVLHVGSPLPPDATLWYGWGNNPYCNLRDAQDMAVPVFGPLEIKR